MKFRLPISIRFILSIYFIGMLFFTLFRLVLVFSNLKAINEIPGKWGIMAESMYMGIRFDTVISGYILAAPTLLLITADAFKLLKPGILLFTLSFVSALYVVSFFGCAADIPFFNTYNARLNFTILNWTASPLFMIKMIFEEWSYRLFFFLFVVISVVYIISAARMYRRYKNRMGNGESNPFTAWSIIISLVFVGLEFLGIRGRIDEKSPIVQGTAYFCKYDIANQAGLNPIYTFMQSWLDSYKPETRKLSFMNDQDAIKLTRHYLGIDAATANADYPIARVVKRDPDKSKYNVVVVIMESMSANFMRRYGDTLGLTPILDSIADHGIAFDNLYSAGIHTFNGIYSTMYGFPALMAKHTMEGVPIPAFTGLPYAAKKNNYYTLYFTTHDDQFDNVGGFLTANNIDTLISKKDYPSSKVLTTLGVPDHYMFDYAIPVLNDAYDAGRPFVVFMMTASNHTPYTVPADIPFKPVHTEVRKGCVEYADWAIGQFLTKASAQKWFSNTVFVFVADHGAREGAEYGDFYLGYNHIPFIIYAPSIITKPLVINSPGGQIDVYPTIAGILGLSYTNNTMGMDLLHETRKYICFSQDDKIGVADTGQLYIWHKDGMEAMYALNNPHLPLRVKDNKKADNMKFFAFSMLQATQWVIDNHKSGPVK